MCSTHALVTSSHCSRCRSPQSSKNIDEYWLKKKIDDTKIRIKTVGYIYNNTQHLEPCFKMLHKCKRNTPLSKQTSGFIKTLTGKCVVLHNNWYSHKRRILPVESVLQSVNICKIATVTLFHIKAKHWHVFTLIQNIIKKIYNYNIIFPWLAIRNRHMCATAQMFQCLFLVDLVYIFHRTVDFAPHCLYWNCFKREFPLQPV